MEALYELEQNDDEYISLYKKKGSNYNRYKVFLGFMLFSVVRVNNRILKEPISILPEFHWWVVFRGKHVMTFFSYPLSN